MRMKYETYRLQEPTDSTPLRAGRKHDIMTISQCPQCHTPLKELSNFCHHCGAKVPASQTAPAGPANSAHAASQTQFPDLPRVQFREPTEGAFTALVPQDWQTHGRLV